MPNRDDPAPLCLIRLVTYNVHGCVGTDGQLSEERIGDVLAALEPDVVALQELDVGRERSSRGHQPEKLAQRLSMNFLFSPSVRDGDEHYGHALLSRYPLRHVQSEELPRVFWPRPTEPRSALWAGIDVCGIPLQIVSTHLGLSPLERLRQTRALLGERWMGSAEFRGARVVCGDFNAGPWSFTYRALRGSMIDAHRCAMGLRARATYPSRMPVLRLDHVFASKEVTVRAAGVFETPLARVASDHLPLVADLGLLAMEAAA